MRTVGTVVGLTLFALSGSALAQENPASEETPAQTAAPEAAPATAPGAPPKLTLGVDAAAQIPVSSALRDMSAVGFGGLLRVEFNVIPNLNATARGGYVYGLKHNVSDQYRNIDYKMSTIPIWVGGKYFVTDMVYGALEVGYNQYKWSYSGTLVGQPSYLSGSESKFGGTVGAGALIGPIDVKAQLEILNLGNLSDSIAVMINVGYNFLRLL